jgi:hypothetical protein
MGPVSPLLHQYDGLLGDLATADDDEAAADILLRCSRLVAEIKSKFALTTREGGHGSRRGSSGSLNRKLSRQRQFLCDLEIERLRALSVARYNHMLTDGDKPQRIVGDRRDQLRKAFDAICEFRNDAKLLVRPVVMMSYWKYVLALEIGKELAASHLRGELDQDSGFSPSSTYKDLAMYHLRLAYDELDQDDSLPGTSIYRILVPRSLAAETRKEVVQLFVANGNRTSPEIWRRSQLAADIKFAITRALALALQAYNKAFGSGAGRDPRVGDLIYGHEKDENVHDADVITSLLDWHFRLLGEPGYQALGTTREFLLARATEARNFVRSDDTRDWAPNRVEAIEMVLMQLNKR